MSDFQNRYPDFVSPFESQSESPLKIYVGTCLTHPANRSLLDLCRKMAVAALRRAGFIVHDPSEHTHPKSPHYANEVFALDYLGVSDADVIFFIRVDPSIGMGIEAQIAANLIIPYCQVRPDARAEDTTPMLFGLANAPCGEDHTICLHTSDAERFRGDLIKTISSGLIQKHAMQVRRERQAYLDFIRTTEPGLAIRRQRLLLNMPVDELSAFVDIQPERLLCIEKDVTYFSSSSLTEILRIADATELQFVDMTTSGQLACPRLASKLRFDTKVVDAATQFARYTLRSRRASEPEQENDEQMRLHWLAWLGSQGLSLPERRRERVYQESPSLTVMMLLPVSGLSNEARDLVDSVSSQIQKSVKSMPNTRIVDPRSDSFTNTPESIRRGVGSDIYAEQVRRLVRSDLVIAILYPPATGVGIMSMVASSLTMQQMAVTTAGQSVSRMYTGLVDPSFFGQVVKFETVGDIEGAIRAKLVDRYDVLLHSAAARRRVIDKILEAGPLHAIHRHCIRSRIKPDQFAREITSRRNARVESCWMENVTRFPELSSTLTFIQLLHIAERMRWSIAVTAGVPCLREHVDSGPQILHSSMENLASVCENDGWCQDHDRVFVEWEKCVAGFSSRVKRGESPRPVSKQEWRDTLFPKALIGDGNEI